MSSSDATHPDVIVGELALVDGQRQTDVAHMALLTPPRRARSDRRSETLLVFLDLGGASAGGLARAMIERLGRAYWRHSGPVTSALRQAINAANAHLREENRLMPISNRRRGGVMCAVLRDDYLYLAHVGPARALLVQREQVERFAARPEDGLPLGVSSGLDILFSRSFVSAGDRLLLTGDNWTGGLLDSALTEALRAKDLTDVVLNLERRVGTKPFSVLVVECAPSEETPARAAETDQRPLPPVSAPSYADVTQQELHTLVDAGPPDLVPHGPRPPAFESTSATRVGFEPSESESSSQLDAAPSASTGVAFVDARTESVQPEGRLRPSKPLVSFSFGPGRLDRSRRGFRRIVATLGTGAHAALTRVLPEPERAFRRGGRRAKDASVDNVPMMAGVAVAIPLLVAFLVVTFYLQRGDAQRRGSVVHQARRALETAQQAGTGDDPVLWRTAIQSAEEALLVAPGDEEILAILNEARARLDELDTVVRPELEVLWDYGQGQGRRLAATRLQVYVLDTTQGEVTHKMLGEAGQSVNGVKPALVTYRDHSVADELIGGLRDIVWLSATGPWSSDALLILTEDNRLLQYNPSWGLSWMPFESDLTPENVRALRPYDGKLYALDPLQHEVWRLPYTGNGFGPPEAYFRAPVPDLSNAVDLAIDGAVYILLGDGKILRFFGGEPQPFDIEGLPQEFSRPVALVSEGETTNGALYLADAGTQSIVVLTKDGKFVNQFKADGDTLANIEALAIDEESRTLFVLANGQLYALALPLLPELPGTSE